MPNTSPPRLIDFHSHYFDAAWYPSSPTQGPGNLLRAWPLLTAIEAQRAAMSHAGIDAKVLSAPTSTLVASGEPLPMAQAHRINDDLATPVARYPQRLLGLA